MKFQCNDNDHKTKHIIFDEELWLCAGHYESLQKQIFQSEENA